MLASASPARLETLRRAGVEPEVIVSGVDEDAITAATPRELVQLLAAAKANAVRDIAADALILGCDSLLELDGEALGKPGSVEVAAQRWRRLRGNTGILHTGHELLAPTFSASVTVSTVVHFAAVTDDEIERYVVTGEPSSVAGAFTVDGLGGWFIDGIEGDHHNVVGLSLPALRRMLREHGLGLPDLGYPGKSVDL
ncbi:MAG TPA: nucleoside triphosphate pyrophosphatase [Jatrophihabitantaceae bacterium]